MPGHDSHGMQLLGAAACHRAANRCSSLDVVDHPVHSIEQTVTRNSAAGHDAPIAVLHSLLLVKFEHFSDFLRRQGAGHILLVAENEQSCSSQFFLTEQLGQLPLAVLESEFVAAIDYPDQSIRLLEVIAPVRADRRLSSDIPDVQLEPIVLDRLNLESKCRGDFRRVFAQELLHNRRLPSVVKAED